MHSIPKAQTPTIEDSPDILDREEGSRQNATLAAWADSAFRAYMAKVPPRDGNVSNYYEDFDEFRKTVLKDLRDAGFTDERLANYYVYHELMATGKWDVPKIDFPEPYSMKSFYRKIIEQYGGTIPTPAKEEWFAYRSEIETLHRRAHQALDNYFGNEKEGVQDKRDIVYERLWQEHKERLYDAGYRSVSQHDFRKDKNIGGNIAVHVRMGSGIPYEKAPELDFPGDLSVRKFYEDIIEKYGSKTEEHKQ